MEKRELKMKKRIIVAAVSFAMMAMSLQTCSKPNVDAGNAPADTASVSESAVSAAPSEITAKLIADIEMSSLAEVQSDRIEMYLDVDLEKVESFSMFICGSGGFADEVGVFRMKSDADCEALKALITERLDKRKVDFEDYNPDEFEKLGKAVCGVSGNYVYYAVTPDSDKAESTIKEFIG